MKPVVFIFLFIPLLALSGEVEDYKLLLKNLSEAKSLSGLVETHYYHAGKQAAYKIEKGEFAYANKNSYVKYDNYVTVNDGKQQLVVDSQKKIIILDGVDKSELSKEFTEQMKLPAITDSLIKKQISLKYILNNETTKILQLVTTKKSNYEKIEIEMNAAATALKRITYYFSGSGGGPSKIDVLYKSMVLDETVNDKLFSFSKFISLTKSGVTLLPAYSSYELIDYRKRK